MSSGSPPYTLIYRLCGDKDTPILVMKLSPRFSTTSQATTPSRSLTAPCTADAVPCAFFDTLSARRCSNSACVSLFLPVTPEASFVTLSQPGTAVMIFVSVFGPTSIGPYCVQRKTAVAVPFSSIVVTVVFRNVYPFTSCTSAP